MSKLAFVFPGQGSQKVGMGKDLADQFQAAREVFEQADEALGFSLRSIIWEGPEDQLRLTYYAQPAILAMSIACLRVFQSEIGRTIEPSYVAGHSLGEYSALVASGSLSFEDAVRSVHQRGRFMDEAVPAGLGAMSAILGMEREELTAICKEASTDDSPVEPVNLNCPGQIVISGAASAVARAGEMIREKGARVIELVVSGPFHSSLMKPAAQKLSAVLEGIQMNAAKYPVVANVSAKPIVEPADILLALEQQVAAPVLWEDSIRHMMDNGVEQFIEFGPGNVLSGMIKKINRRMPALAVGDIVSLQSALDQLKELES